MSDKYKQWKRWVEVDPHFPKPKYNFTTHLKRIGDYVETYPLDYADRIRIRDAAKFWAWHHKKRVSIRSIPDGTAKWRMRITLISHTRERIIEDI